MSLIHIIFKLNFKYALQPWERPFNIEILKIEENIIKKGIISFIAGLPPMSSSQQHQSLAPVSSYGSPLPSSTGKTITPAPPLISFLPWKVKIHTSSSFSSLSLYPPFWKEIVATDVD